MKLCIRHDTVTVWTTLGTMASRLSIERALVPGLTPLVPVTNLPDRRGP